MKDIGLVIIYLLLIAWSIKVGVPKKPRDEKEIK